MNLNIYERIVLPEILPDKGSIIEMILVESIKKKVEINTNEIEQYSIKENEGVITWDKNKDNGTEIDFENSELTIIKKQCTELDENKQVTERNLSICRKFINV